MSREQKIDSFVNSLMPSVHLPFNRMEVGRSQNLLSWNGSAPSTGWTANRSTLSEVTTPTPPISAKALKVLANDAGGVGNSSAVQLNNSTYTKYLGITLNFKAFLQALSTNALSQKLTISDGVTVSRTAVAKNDTWGLVSLTHKLVTNATQISAVIEVKQESTANTTDILYADNPVITVPQSMEKSGYGRLCHPEGCFWTPRGFSFDGVDDLLTFESDFIGTSACTIMGWIKPTGWSTNPRISDNGKTAFYASNTEVTAGLRFTSNGGTTISSAANALALNRWNHIAVVRTAAGLASFYVDGALSGTANQNSGTPASGATNVIVGNRLAGGRGFAGNIDDLVTVNRVLTPLEIRRHMLLTGWSKR